MIAECGLPGYVVQYLNATGVILKVLWTLRFLLPGHAQPGFAIGAHSKMYSGNTTLPTMRPRSDAFYDVICTHANHCPCCFHPAHSLAPICSANWRHGNMPVPSQCGTSLMQVVQKSIAPKDNLHHTSVASPPATMVPVHDMNHAPKGSAQATIRIR